MWMVDGEDGYMQTCLPLAVTTAFPVLFDSGISPIWQAFNDFLPDEQYKKRLNSYNSLTGALCTAKEGFENVIFSPTTPRIGLS